MGGKTLSFIYIFLKVYKKIKVYIKKKSLYTDYNCFKLKQRLKGFFIYFKLSLGYYKGYYKLFIDYLVRWFKSEEK